MNVSDILERMPEINKDKCKLFRSDVECSEDSAECSSSSSNVIEESDVIEEWYSIIYYSLI